MSDNKANRSGQSLDELIAEDLRAMHSLVSKPLPPGFAPRVCFPLPVITEVGSYSSELTSN